MRPLRRRVARLVRQRPVHLPHEPDDAWDAIPAGHADLVAIAARFPDRPVSDGTVPAALVQQAQRTLRTIALTDWTARRLDLPLVHHDGCALLRVLPGQATWRKAWEALPALLRAEADRGDGVAAKMLAELPRLFA